VRARTPEARGLAGQVRVDVEGGGGLAWLPPPGKEKGKGPGSTTTTTTTSTQTTATNNVGKVTLCHRTGSVTHPYVKITVPSRAAQAHLKHGDVMPDANGACPAGSSGTAGPTGPTGATGVTGTA
jgi:hypothetical protein